MTHNRVAPAPVDQGAIDDLQARLRAFRRVPCAAPGWSGGVDSEYLSEVISYWADTYDWRVHEDRIRALPWGVTAGHESPLRFIHHRGGESSLPVVLLHGWPDSILRYERLLPLLEDLNVVIPALPGYPFALPVTGGGLPTEGIARSVASTMAELGYDRYVLSGGDIGVDVAEVIAAECPDRVAALHFTDVSQNHLLLSAEPEDLTTEERAYIDAGRQWQGREGGYGHEQSTKPSTLSAALGDSPGGLAAWIVEKLRSWSDCNGDVESVFPRDDMLTWITAYWVTESIGTSFAPYAGRTPPTEHFRPPAAFSFFAHDILNAPRSYAARFFDVRHWFNHDDGGHFAAWEQPSAYASHLRAAISLADSVERS